MSISVSSRAAELILLGDRESAHVRHHGAARLEVRRVLERVDGDVRVGGPGVVDGDFGGGVGSERGGGVIVGQENGRGVVPVVVGECDHRGVGDRGRLVRGLGSAGVRADVGGRLDVGANIADVLDLVRAPLHQLPIILVLVGAERERVLEDLAGPGDVGARGAADLARAEELHLEQLQGCLARLGRPVLLGRRGGLEEDEARMDDAAGGKFHGELGNVVDRWRSHDDGGDGSLRLAVGNRGILSWGVWTKRGSKAERTVRVVVLTGTRPSTAQVNGRGCGWNVCREDDLDVLRLHVDDGSRQLERSARLGQERVVWAPQTRDVLLAILVRDGLCDWRSSHVFHLDAGRAVVWLDESRALVLDNRRRIIMKVDEVTLLELV